MNEYRCNYKERVFQGDRLEEKIVGEREDNVLVKVEIDPHKEPISKILETQVQAIVEDVKLIVVGKERDKCYKAIVRGNFQIMIDYLTINEVKDTDTSSYPFEQVIRIDPVVSSLLKAKICIENFYTQKLSEKTFKISIVWDAKVRGIVKAKSCRGWN